MHALISSFLESPCPTCKARRKFPIDVTESLTEYTKPSHQASGNVCLMCTFASPATVPSPVTDMMSPLTEEA